MKEINSRLLKWKLCLKPFNLEEWILAVLFLGSILFVRFISPDESLIVPVFIGAYIIPVSTFANNFSNLLFLGTWLSGLILLFLLYEEPFFIGLSVMLLLYFVAKYLFINASGRDLVFGSSSGARISNTWFSGKSRVDNSRGDSQDKNYQMALVFIAIACLFLVFNRKW